MSEPQNDKSSSSSSSSPGGISGWLFGRNNFLGAWADEQRLERLKQCQDFELALQACERRREAALRGEDIPIDSSKIEEEKSGQAIKIERYYQWNEMAGKKGLGPEEELQIKDTEPPVVSADGTVVTPSTVGKENGKPEIPNCARESHAVWACRALAMGCAVDMMKLKQCFQESNRDVLEVAKTEYEENTGINSSLQSDEVAICGVEQKKLGECVKKNAFDLERRINERSEA